MARLQWLLVLGLAGGVESRRQQAQDVVDVGEEMVPNAGNPPIVVPLADAVAMGDTADLAAVMATALPGTGYLPPGALDLPIYCRALRLLVEQISNQPLMKDITATSTADLGYFVGNVTFTLTDFELGHVSVKNCGSNIDIQGNSMQVGAEELEIEIVSIGWSYKMDGWPHFTDSGTTWGKTRASVSATVDLNKTEFTDFGLLLGELDVHSKAVTHSWLVPDLTNLLHYVRPIASNVMEVEGRKILDNVLEKVRTHGACSMLQDGLNELDLAQLKFTSKEPIPVAVPLPYFGNVSVSLNSTSFQQPKTMRCRKATFDGKILDLDLEDLAFAVGFDWAYRKEGSSFWHNRGTGSGNAKGGAHLRIDVVNPAASAVEIKLPELELQLSADADDWLYSTLPSIMTPMVRQAMQTLGSMVLRHKLENFLEAFSPRQVPLIEVRDVRKLLDRMT